MKNFRRIKSDPSKVRHATLKEIRAALHKLQDSKQKKILERYFKTAKGEYGYGDQFIGVRVPQTQEVARFYKNARLAILKSLIRSKIHEERLLAITILRIQYEKAILARDEQMQTTLFYFFLMNKTKINNWALVDSSAPYITGHYWFTHPEARPALTVLLNSKSLWDRRIAMMSMFYFIRQKEFKLALEMAEHLLADEEDLIHKASGWMLREIGNRSPATLKKFLKEWAPHMPRTMLRSATK